jgi:hypothetical protein
MTLPNTSSASIFVLGSTTMASQASTLTGWAKRVFAKPIVYEHVPGDDILMTGAV